MVEGNLSLGEIASQFLLGLTPQERGANQQEIYNFVRWFGWEQPVARLTGAEVANYAERLSTSDTDYLGKLGLIRAFLVYAEKKGWTKANLAVHLKIRKGKARLPGSPQRTSPGTLYLTQQGYDNLQSELALLKSKRLGAIDEIRKAAADKDFRENAPLEAAREQRGHLEGKIRELEASLKLAVVIGEKEKTTLRVSIGDSVTLYHLDSGEEQGYQLVSSREVDPARGMISDASPIGKAIIGREQGEVIEVSIPAGKVRYQIKQIERR